MEIINKIVFEPHEIDKIKTLIASAEWKLYDILINKNKNQFCSHCPYDDARMRANNLESVTALLKEIRKIIGD